MLSRIQNVAPWHTVSGESEYAQLLHIDPSRANIDQELFVRYDRSITELSRQLRMTAENGRGWQPHQYLALLFTQHYLNRYFDNSEWLLYDLNQLRREYPAMRGLPNYTVEELRTIALQSATGSGKTLIMHANILQYRQAVKDAGKPLNNIILVTPNELMSEQHHRELMDSGLPARVSSSAVGTDLFSPVEIIDLNKLAEKKGVKHIAVSHFGENNLVLVDEGHLGASGKVWRQHRSELACSGFTIEYSATFNQIVKKDVRLFFSYAKSILFDYPYRTFHAAGYGKDYAISNLPAGSEDTNSRMYLLGCLLSFYLQCSIWYKHHLHWMDFNITRPLWVFLGKTVTGKSKADLETQSDVSRIINFLAWFLAHKNEVQPMLRSLLNGNSGLTNEATGRDYFDERFNELRKENFSQLYENICDRIFHGPGQLKVVYLTRGDGELHLHTANNRVCGVVNVGDSAALYKLFNKLDNADFELNRDPGFAKRLFLDVDCVDSPVNIVIGARRFIGGWNSWRVSTMGLMHVGVGEGPEIIQMFGRGVRLKGWKMSLKRHTKSGARLPPANEQLKELETLRIFGLRANYMRVFRDVLEANGIEEKTTVLLPVIWNISNHNLKIIRLKENHDFAHSTEHRDLPEINALPIVEMNLYSQLQTTQSTTEKLGIGTDHRPVKLGRRYTNFFNRNRIYDRIQARKLQYGWHNLTVRRDDINRLLENTDWYRLYLPPNQLQTSSYKDLLKLEDIAVDLITTCLDRYWRRERSRWEHQHMELTALDETSLNNFGEYQLTVDSQEELLVQDLQILLKDLHEEMHYGIKVGKIMRDILITKPLLYADRKTSKVSIQPVPLDMNEKKVVVDLADLVEAEAPCLQGHELHLIRNLSHGRGVSFFEDHLYYPDFIVWLTQGVNQHIIFIDPKGLVRFGPNERSKVELHKRIKDIEKYLRKTDSNIRLHAYVISVTPPQWVGSDSLSKSSWQEQGVYFLEDEDWATRMLSNALRNKH